MLKDFLSFVLLQLASQHAYCLDHWLSLHHVYAHHILARCFRTARLSDRLAYSHDVQGQNMPPQSRPSASRPRGSNWRAWLLPDAAQPDISQTASASPDT